MDPPFGLEFNEPIEVALQVSQTASQDGGVSAIRLITRAGDDDSESLTDLMTEVILGEELITVRGKLNHFSWVWAVSEEGLEVAMEKVAPVQLVGTLFQVRLVMVNRGSADLQDILVVWRPLTPVEFVSMGVLDPGEPLRDAANLDPDETREGFKVLTLTTNRTLFFTDDFSMQRARNRQLFRHDQRTWHQRQSLCQFLGGMCDNLAGSNSNFN